MLFSTPIFIFFFLPIVLLAYYISPKKYRNFILLLSSIFFYTWGEQKLVILILLSTIIDYTAGLIINKGHRKIGLLLSIGFNLSLLFYFKYGSFFLENITPLLSVADMTIKDLHLFAKSTLPLGISFYTFQTMSYTIDVYTHKIKPTKNILDFATYVTMFPQLVAGPIVKFKDVSEQLKNRSESLEYFQEGATRFILGLGKKVLIANKVALLSDGVFILPKESITMPLAWIGVLAYSIQIYYDFSGYSDMAIGLLKMFGFTIPENFNYPYTSKSIREFWQKWHISLSTWFKEYVYIPLGGNRNSKIRMFLNLSIVFLLCGIWHGANWTFVVWGIWHGSLIILERLFIGKTLLTKKYFAHTYTLMSVGIGWVFFRSDSISEASNFILKMFSFDFYFPKDVFFHYTNYETIIALILGILFSYPIFKNTKMEDLKYLKPALTFIVFVISIFYISIGSYNPFIYFNF